MKKGWMLALITIILAIPAFISGPIIWPPITSPMPTASELPFYIFLAALEALLFGFAVGYFFLTLPYVKRVKPQARGRTIAAFVAIIWLIISWWPHDNLHMHIGLDFARLLGIEYGFHLTLMISSLIVVYYFFKTVKENK